MLSKRLTIFLLRIATGWIFLYGGLSKINNDSWSAAGYIERAQTFPNFFAFFLRPEVLPIVNQLVTYGLTLVGIALIIGAGMRLAAVFGSLMMLLFYLPILSFPYIGQTGYLVDQHIIYILVLLLLAAFRAGRVWGLGTMITRLPLFTRRPRLRNWIE